MPGIANRLENAWGAICMECLKDTPNVVDSCWCPAPGQSYGWVCPECAGKSFDAATRKVIVGGYPLLDTKPNPTKPKPPEQRATLWGCLVAWWNMR